MFRHLSVALIASGAAAVKLHSSVQFIWGDDWGNDSPVTTMPVDPPVSTMPVPPPGNEIKCKMFGGSLTDEGCSVDMQLHVDSVTLNETWNEDPNAGFTNVVETVGGWAGDVGEVGNLQDNFATMCENNPTKRICEKYFAD